ncbi:MAG: beta-ketoacyl-ACP synthase III [Myxococcota bacterium]
MGRLRAAITGVGGWVPEKVLSNQDLEKMVDTNDEWIVSRTGIRERRILEGEDQGVSVIGIHAMRELLAKTGTDPMDIDLVIFATVTKDFVFPATANLISDAVGAKNAFGFDVEAACSGFLYALASGAQFIESGRYKKVVVIGADKMSAILDYEDRATCIIFGDGGGAVLLEPTEDDVGVGDFVMRSDGDGARFLNMPAGGSRRPASHATVDAREHYVKQEGKTVFKFAVKNMADISVQLLQRNNLTANDVTWLVPHQANKRIIDGTAQRLEIPPERVMLNIDRYGNTTSGTLPLCLWDYESQLRRGDKLVLAAFGGGFTWGAMVVDWAYDGSER